MKTACIVKGVRWEALQFSSIEKDVLPKVTVAIVMTGTPTSPQKYVCVALCEKWVRDRNFEQTHE